VNTATLAATLVSVSPHPGSGGSSHPCNCCPSRQTNRTHKTYDLVVRVSGTVDFTVSSEKGVEYFVQKIGSTIGVSANSSTTLGKTFESTETITLTVASE
jgi:hypothetical protein